MYKVITELLAMVHGITMFGSSSSHIEYIEYK